MKALFCALLACLLLLAPAGFTKEKVLGMSKKTYDSINEIQPFIDDEQWDVALEMLAKLRERKLNGYETAHVLNMTGYTWFQMGDNERAMEAYNEALQQEGLPESQVRALLTTVSQVALASANYQAAEAYAKRLLAAETEAPQPLSQVILAQAYIGQESYELAVAPLRKALQMLRDAGSAPRENWMVMLSSVYYSLEDFESMRGVMYELVSLYPSERYLLNLAALHGQLGETERQLALVEALLEDERLEKGYHLVTLANLFMAQGVPLKAAELLDRELEAGRIEATRQNLELTSQAWYMAGEEANAIPPLESAAREFEDAELYLRVARLYMDIYRWRPAEEAARAALEFGDLREPGDAWLLIGMALARGNELEAARTAFMESAEYESSEKWARQWIRFVDNEQARIDSFTTAPGGS